jgi:hypothetical protein
MRDKYGRVEEEARVTTGGYASKPGDTEGLFVFCRFGVEYLRVIVGVGSGWDHVSVSKRYSTPTWDDMCWMKRLFFRDDECAMQLHVPIADHINIHEHCLHLWRPHDLEIPRPPQEMV